MNKDIPVLYERTEGVTMITVFSSSAPMHEVLYWLAANNIPCRVCLGSYRGSIEPAYCIPTVLMPLLLEEQEAWILRDQECLMHVRAVQGSTDNSVVFEYLNDSRTEYMGVLALVSREEALAADGYTYDPMGMTYSVIQ